MLFAAVSLRHGSICSYAAQQNCTPLGCASNIMTKISLSDVCERDIDLLLVEEFAATPDFVKWFLTEIGISATARLNSVSHSVNASNGESDLELEVEVDGETLAILLENKIDAAFQDLQPERYGQRGRSYVLGGACARSTTVIIAPNSYFADTVEKHGFEHRISYEAVLRWFQTAHAASNRRAYKCALLETAITRGQVGWRLVPNEQTTTFWERYWQLASSIVPNLRMPRPGPKPRKSAFVRFRPLGLPKGVELLHKLRFGYVDLQFSRMSARVLELEGRYGDELQPRMRIESASKSAVVRMDVPVIDIAAPFSTSEPAVRAGLESAAKLWSWYRATHTS
jgi:hypothetical protein